MMNEFNLGRFVYLPIHKRNVSERFMLSSKSTPSAHSTTLNMSCFICSPLFLSMYFSIVVILFLFQNTK